MWLQSSKIAQLFCLFSESDMAQPDTFRPCLNSLSRGDNWAVYKGVATGGYPLKYPFLTIPKGALWIQDSTKPAKGAAVNKCGHNMQWIMYMSSVTDICIREHLFVLWTQGDTLQGVTGAGLGDSLSALHICPTLMLSLLPCLHTGSQVPILGHFGFLSHYLRLNLLLLRCQHPYHSSGSPSRPSHL